MKKIFFLLFCSLMIVWIRPGYSQENRLEDLVPSEDPCRGLTIAMTKSMYSSYYLVDLEAEDFSEDFFQLDNLMEQFYESLDAEEMNFESGEAEDLAFFEFLQTHPDYQKLLDSGLDIPLYKRQLQCLLDHPGFDEERVDFDNAVIDAEEEFIARNESLVKQWEQEYPPSDCLTFFKESDCSEEDQDTAWSNFWKLSVLRMRAIAKFWGIQPPG